MKITLSLTIILLIAFFVSCGKTETEIKGDIFVATNGGQSVKLGATAIYLFRQPKADGYGAQLETFLDNADHKTVSDADGKFSFKVPAGKYVIAARSSRDVFGKTENYRWRVPVGTASETTTISLNNQNLTAE